jgi:hypothetical protein
MKYLCIIYGDEDRLADLQGREQEYEALRAESRAYLEELKRGGHFLASERLQRVATARSVRVTDGRISVTDGPFAETKEQVGGFVLLEARDLEEATQLAAKLPPARLGGVEVRPIWVADG